MENSFNKSYRALFYDELDEYNNAISFLSRYLEKNGNNVHALNNRAVANSEIGNIQAAKVDLEKVLEIGAIDYVPYLNLGNIYENEDNLELALNLYNQAIELWPNEVTCYRARAYALSKAQMWAQSIPDFDKAIELDPAWRKTYLDRATAKENSGDMVGANEDRAMAESV